MLIQLSLMRFEQVISAVVQYHIHCSAVRCNNDQYNSNVALTEVVQNVPTCSRIAYNSSDYRDTQKHRH